ncbi:MAG: hypothetical protein WDO70_09045 [Alphaproteobacteria bacterium]
MDSITPLSFFVEAGMASAYLALKLFLVYSTGRFARAKSAFDRTSSLIAGWLMVQVLQSGIILGLSAIDLMRWPYFLVCIVLCAALIHWRTRKLQFGAESIRTTWRVYLPLMAIACVFLAMWLRSMFLYDYTWDAQTYGLPRLVIWLNAGSVFVHMPTPQLNLFVNEWNGEFNALAYALASGSYLGFAFGNLEVLLTLFAASAWTAFLLGAPLFWALCLAAILGSTPAMLGLASTVKGDLLACAGFIMACGWLVYIRRNNRSPLAFGMLMLAAALAVGAKVSAALPVVAILILAIGSIGWIGFRGLWRSPRWNGLGLIAGLLIFSSRFWTNWVVYGNPLKRVDGEQATFGLGHMLANFKLAGEMSFGVWQELQGKGQMWALAGSMGATAWLITIAAAWSMAAIIRQCRMSPALRYPLMTSSIRPQWLVLTGLGILAATAASMTLSDAYPWAFRYFAPAIMALFLGIGALAIRRETAGVGGVFAIAAVLTVIANLAITARPGEVIPTPLPGPMMMEIKQADTPLKRLSLFNKGAYQTSMVDTLGLDAEKPLNALVLNELNTSLVPVLGSRAQNRIQTVANGAALLVTAAQPGWDAVAIIQKKESLDRNLSVALERQGYWIAINEVCNHAYYVVALPKSRIELIPVADLKGMQWTTWNAASGAKLKIRNGLPEVENVRPVDAGFVSQELRLDGSTLVKASFEGEVAGTGDHAAHLSLFGRQFVVTLSPGKYSSSQSFQAIIPALGKDSMQRLVFGLGGWVEGSGHLRLTSLEVFQLRIVAREDAAGPKQESSFPMALIFTMTLLVGCAVVGRSLFLACGITNLSLMGFSFVLGYGIFGLMLLLSLKYTGNLAIGAVIFAIGAAAIARREIRLKITAGAISRQSFNIARIKARVRVHLDGFVSRPMEMLILAVIVSWVVAVALVYLPMATLAEDLLYQFPDIFDLPKHLFAQMSLYKANGWPPPSPFLSNEAFAYNFLFYFPPALVARLIGSPLANFQTFPFAVIAIGVALPMTILDIARHVTRAKSVHLGSVFLATWVGGLTPLLVKGTPPIGFFLYTEKLLTTSVWVDEPLQSLIFVPQHVFAVLCGLAAMFLWANVRFGPGDYKRIFLAGIITVVGALSSFILLPHLAVSLAVGMALIFFLHGRSFGRGTLKAIKECSLVMAALILPCILVFPFLIEILQWSGGTGVMATIPKLSSQWLYVLAAIGTVVPLAIIGLTPVLRGPGSRDIDSPGRRTLAGAAILAFVGMIGLSFGGYPDAGVKSGLWMRIVLVPLAGIGLLVLSGKMNCRRNKTLGLLAAAVLFLGIALLNFPTTKYYIQSAWRPIDPGVKIFINHVRALPRCSRIAIFSPAQVLAALSGRQMDFDFSLIRADAYMPPAGRLRAKHFWDGLMQKDSEAWSELHRHYDTLVAPAGSAADGMLAGMFKDKSSVGGYSIYPINNACGVADVN